MKNTIEGIEYASLLYDFYGELLDDNKRDILDLYYGDNLSLTEIAEDRGMTRQAVHYSLKKGEAKLEEFESKLGLVAKYHEQQRQLEDAEPAIDRLLNNDCFDEQTRADIKKVLNLLRDFEE